MASFEIEARDDEDGGNFENPLAARFQSSAAAPSPKVAVFESEGTSESEDAGGVARAKKIKPWDSTLNIQQMTIGEYVRAFLLGKTWTLLVMTATFLALFQADLCTIYFGKRADKPLALITFTVFLIFAFEMVMNFVLKIDYGALPCTPMNMYILPRQLTFYMSLDLIGTLSLIPDFVILFNIEFDAPGSLILARVARAARIGARLTRLMKLFRSRGGESIYSQMAMGDEEQMEDSPASAFGTAVSDGVSKRVVLLTLLLLIVVPLFLPVQSDEIYRDDKALDFLELLPRESIVAGFVRDGGALHFYQKFEGMTLVYFALKDDSKFLAPSHRQMQGGCETYNPVTSRGILADRGPADYLNDGRALNAPTAQTLLSNYYFCDEDNATWACPVACLGTKADKLKQEFPLVDWVDPGLYGSMRKKELHTLESDSGTMKATFYTRHFQVFQAQMSVLSMLFNMVVFGSATGAFLNGVFELVVNPMERMCAALKHLSKTFSMLSSDGDDDDELASLGTNILKLTDLLKVGLGEAGAKMIAKNFRNDTDELEIIVPGTRMTGYFGMAFIHDFRQLQKVLDEDIMIFVNLISDVVHSKILAHMGTPNKNMGDSFLCTWSESEEIVFGSGNEDMTFADHALKAFTEVQSELDTNTMLAEMCQRPGFVTDTELGHRVRMGFGLHYGWAVEGAVGSLMKVDATYLSPHVNMCARLEAVTAQYHCMILLSEDLYKKLSPAYQRRVYKVDNVILEGMSVPTIVYAYDEAPDEGTHHDKKTRFSFEYDQAVENYIHGDWVHARKYFDAALAERPNSQGVLAQLEFMDLEAVKGPVTAMGAPVSWRGYRHNSASGHTHK